MTDIQTAKVQFERDGFCIAPPSIPQALLQRAITHMVNQSGGKWAEPGSVRWAFEQAADSRGHNAEQRGQWTAKFPQEISKEDAGKLESLIEALDEHDDVQEVYTNAK